MIKDLMLQNVKLKMVKYFQNEDYFQVNREVIFPTKEYMYGYELNSKHHPIQVVN